MADYASSRTYFSVVMDYADEKYSKQPSFEEARSDISLNRFDAFSFASKLSLNKPPDRFKLN